MNWYWYLSVFIIRYLSDDPFTSEGAGQRPYFLLPQTLPQTTVFRKLDTDEPTPIGIFFLMAIVAHALPCGASLVWFSDIRLDSVGFLTEVRTGTVETITEEVGPKRESNLSVMWLWYHTQPYTRSGQPQAWLEATCHMRWHVVPHANVHMVHAA